MEEEDVTGCGREWAEEGEMDEGGWKKVIHGGTGHRGFSFVAMRNQTGTHGEGGTMFCLRIHSVVAHQSERGGCKTARRHVSCKRFHGREAK